MLRSDINYRRYSMKYLFLIRAGCTYIDPDWECIDLNSASMRDVAIYQSHKCWNDIKNDYRVDFIFYWSDRLYVEHDYTILDSRFDDNETYISIDFGGIYSKIPSINSISTNFKTCLEVLLQYYDRKIIIGDWYELDKLDKKKRYLVKPYEHKDHHRQPFIYPDDRKELGIDAEWWYDKPIIISEYDEIFSKGTEYRVILVNKKIHSIQRYPDESEFDDGGEIILAFANLVISTLELHGILDTNPIFSFDIVTDGEKCKVVEFHNNTCNLGHYHKTNQNNYSRYVDLLTEDR